MARRQGELMAKHTQMKNSGKETTDNNLLELKNVSKAFYRSDTATITTAIKNINLKVQDGEFVSIVGPSGCGKSTILRLVAGLIRPTRGELILNGEEIDRPSPDRGMVFQHHTLFPWLTVEENVGYSLKNNHNISRENGQRQVDSLINMVGLDEFKNTYPHQLSGGMAQRVALIRTMISEPSVFLLDEPLGALDAFTRMTIQDELIGMWQRNKHIMMMVTHDVDEAIYMSSRVIIMAPRPGRIIEDLKINLPYPRNRMSDEFIDYRKHIMGKLEIEG